MMKYSENWTSIPEMPVCNAFRFGPRTAIAAEKGESLLEIAPAASSAK
jgi:hypothetical protein